MTIRAVVVDDSKFMRTLIADGLEAHDVSVVAHAGDGAEAVDAVVEHEPDVVTMDVEMPVMDGVSAVEEIMAVRPTPILMLSAHTDEGAEVTFDALERGAVDFFAKPGDELSIEIARFGDELATKVRAVARSTVSADGPVGASAPRAAPPEAGVVESATVIIGASTGGPRVVEDVVAGLPAEADLRVVVVQHMPSEFTARYAQRLDGATEYAFGEAADRTRLRGGEGVVAPGDAHLEVTGSRRDAVVLGLTREPPRHGVRPAIDVTLESAAASIDDGLVAVLLTGMGADGAAGAEAVAATGGTVLAQDEATSAVFGIPKRAIETGCVDEVLPAGDIPRAIVESVTRSESIPRGEP